MTYPPPPENWFVTPLPPRAKNGSKHMDLGLGGKLVAFPGRFHPWVGGFRISGVILGDSPQRVRIQKPVSHSIKTHLVTPHYPMGVVRHILSNGVPRAMELGHSGTLAEAEIQNFPWCGVPASPGASVVPPGVMQMHRKL